LFSPDDHLVEPPWLFSRYLPEKARKNPDAPRVERQTGRIWMSGGVQHYEQSPDGQSCDVWVYEGQSVPTPRSAAVASANVADANLDAVTFEEMRPGFYTAADRLADMELAGIGASVCFPNIFVQFCGQRFLNARDKDLALACVRAYNDFMLEEWCADSGGRLVPLCIAPLWDIDLATSEVQRNAARGALGVCFSELPTRLGLPSIHSGRWDPFFEQCVAAGTVLMIHIGSGSTFSTTSDDAPMCVQASAAATNSVLAVLDWICSGALVKYPTLKVCIAESQIGWVPYFLQRTDQVWDQQRGYNDVWGRIPRPPSQYFQSNMACTFFDDDVGLDNIDRIGIENVLFESDYPHGDSNWPNSLDVGKRMTAKLPPNIAKAVLWDNAAKLFNTEL
jgi:predicted TIM-barrel fold metal-dependent hydrolase